MTYVRGTKKVGLIGAFRSKVAPPVTPPTPLNLGGAEGDRGRARLACAAQLRREPLPLRLPERSGFKKSIEKR